MKRILENNDNPRKNTVNDIWHFATQSSSVFKLQTNCQGKPPESLRKVAICLIMIGEREKGSRGPLVQVVFVQPCEFWIRVKAWLSLFCKKAISLSICLMMARGTTYLREWYASLPVAGMG